MRPRLFWDGKISSKPNITLDNAWLARRYLLNFLLFRSQFRYNMCPQRKKCRTTKKPVRLRCTGTSSTDNGEGQQIIMRCRRKRALKEGQTKSTILCSKCEHLQSLSDTQPTESLLPPGTISSMGKESIAFYGFSVQCTGKLSNRAV